MAVDGPRNNLQQHLAWFNSQTPQIPPRGQRQPLTTSNINLSTHTVNTVTRQPLSIQNPLSRAANMPTPANMRNSTLIAPRRSEMKPKVQEIEIVSFESPSTSDTITGKVIADKVKRDFPQGMPIIFMINLYRFANSYHSREYCDSINSRDDRSYIWRWNRYKCQNERTFKSPRSNPQ